jgi:hypothetical protein
MKFLPLALAFLVAGCGSGERLPRPVDDVEAAARAFKLYYRERVERVMVSYNRFMLVGDLTFGTNIGKVGIAKQGTDYEVVPGPNDNNPIGISIWTTWHAYKIFRTRTLELTLVRMFNGLRFFEEVSGHPGVTSRFVFPGWTRIVDGKLGTATRTRGGLPASAPTQYSPELEAEIMEAFYNGIRVTYREDPEDVLFNYMPAVEPQRYSVIYSFSALPAYLRSSDCCASVMRTPAPYQWEGAYWGNHNSRDNFPDLSLGLVTAMEAAKDKSVPDEVREAAEGVVEAANRIGDLIVQNDALMTVGEHQPYDQLMNSGAVRPDGEIEGEDLGTLADCQMAYLSRAISSSGLDLPLPEVSTPASPFEELFTDLFGEYVDCEVGGGTTTCTRVEEAFCGWDWSNLEEMTIYDQPWLEMIREMEDENPGTAAMLMGSWQDDYYEITLAATALVNYADLMGNRELGERARTTLAGLAHLMRVFADLIYSHDNPGRLAEQTYRAALFEGWGGLEPVPLEDLGGFTAPENETAYIESWLTMDDTQPAALLTDERIREMVAGELEGSSDTVKKRYADNYGDTPPVRLAGEGYEARGVPEAEHPWQPAERPHHRIVGGVHLLQALPLCNTAPEILDCTWAALGCRRPDLNADGTVDAADTALFEAARDGNADASCRAKNDWCQGADLDRTGRVDEVDAAFMQAAQGCYY